MVIYYINNSKYLFQQVMNLLLISIALLSQTVAEYCMGDLIWNATASVCIPTCTAHFYPDDELCPDKTLARCVCPEGKIKLKDTEDTCVSPDSTECQAATKNYMDDPSNQFKFTKEPQDVTVTMGDSVTLSCLVSNKYSIQYIWYKLDKLPEGDATAKKNLYMTGTSEIVFKKIQASEAGFYQCKAVANTNFLMLSSVGHVRVKHFTAAGQQQVSKERVVLNDPLFELKCAEFSADPAPSLRWYHDGAPLNWETANYFMNKNPESKNYGTLYISNVQEAHDGTYVCKGISATLDIYLELAKRIVTITGSQNTLSGNPEIIESANFGSYKRLGETAELYCAGYGYPAPTISWSKSVQIGVKSPLITGCTETLCVKEAGRKLVIYKLNSDQFGSYKCTVSNTVGSLERVLSVSRAPESYSINFIGISPPVKVQPNRYTSFTLTCIVDISQNSNIYMGWYQNTLGLANKEDRVRINSSRNEEQGKSIQELIFDYPTRDDHGVYQCLAYNQQYFKQATTDVFVYTNVAKDVAVSDGDFASGMYDPNAPRKYKYFSEFKTAAEAQAACKEWNREASLATILDVRESNMIFEIIMENKNDTNCTTAWIGLTDEATEGVWLWITGEVSNKFSFWWTNRPDNSVEDRDYAYVDAAKSGHWLDGSGTDKMPFICKYYNATCASLENRDDLGFTFRKYVKKQYDGAISVYDTAEITCDNSNAVLVCSSAGRWVLSSGKCKAVQSVTDGTNSASIQAISILLVLTTVLLSIT